MLKSKTKIQKMFDTISNEYDMLNNIITFGQHKKWKSKVYKLARSKNPKLILDVATGTADIAIFLSQIKNCKIIGIDISKKMLAFGQKKIEQLSLNDRIKLETGDVESLKYSDNYFNVVTIGYGVRNFENLELGLKESNRVLKKNGTIIILETSVPQNKFIKVIYNIFSFTIIPFIGKIFSKNPSAYKYLNKSASIFPSGKMFEKILVKVGFRQTQSIELLFGASTIYIAKK